MGACDFGVLVFLQDLKSDGSAPFAILSHRHTFLADLVVPLGTREGSEEGAADTEGIADGTSEGAADTEGMEEGTSDGAADTEGMEEGTSEGAAETEDPGHPALITL